MNKSANQFSVVSTEPAGSIDANPLHAQPSSPDCKRCIQLEKDLVRERKQFKAKAKEMEKRIERLHRALQRESHHIDTRAPHDGKNYIERHR